MTLRDHFASLAPVTVEDAMLVCGISANAFGMLLVHQRQHVMIALADMRYAYADAMLVERAK